MSAEIKDGIYYDVPDAEYRAWPFPSYSGVKIIASGGMPAHYRAYMTEPNKGSKSKNFGTYAHMALLEPERLDAIKALPEQIKRRTGDDWKKLQEEFPRFTFLSPSEWKAFEPMRDQAYRVRDNAMEHPIACDLLRRSKKEVSFVWTDEDIGIRLKGRADGWTGESIVDVKTTGDMMPYYMARKSYGFGYDVQVAMYTDGLTKLSGIPLAKFWFIFIESNPPNQVVIFNGHSAYDERINDCNPAGFYALGRDRYKQALRTIKECQESGIWYGHANDVMEMVIPKWAESEV